MARLIILFLLAGHVSATELIPEATQSGGQGQQQYRYQLWYSGICAEHIGVDVGYSGRQSLTDITDNLHQYVKDSLPILMQRCPQARVIHVEASGKPRDQYRFLLSKDSGWSVSNTYWVSELAADYARQGFEYFSSAPFRHAVMKLQDSQLLGHYGPRLQHHFISTGFEKHMLPDAQPARVHYLAVKGYWYQLSAGVRSTACAESRDGYGYWGSYIMRFYPGQNSVSMDRKACAEFADKGKGDKVRFATPMPSQAKGWGVTDRKSVQLLYASLEALNISPVGGVQKLTRSDRKPLYESDLLTIYPTSDDWCLERRLDAVYKVDSASRDREFGGNYARNIAGHVYQLVKEYCQENPLTGSVNNYQQGEQDYWDQMSFQFRPQQSQSLTPASGYPKLITHNKSQSAKQHQAYLQANHLGPACQGAPFCELPGGRYLNAIYRGDVATVKEIDALYVKEFYRERLGASVGSGNPFKDIFGGIVGDLNTKELLLTGDAVNKYMYVYKDWPQSCLEPGAESKVFEYTTPVVVETDPWGMTHRSGGDYYKATYITNPEFFTLRDRVGSAYGSQRSDNPWLVTSKHLVFKGLVEMKQSYDCKSQDVKIFEQNLIRISTQLLDQRDNKAHAGGDNPAKSIPDRSDSVSAAAAEPPGVKSAAGISQGQQVSEKAEYRQQAKIKDQGSAASKSQSAKQAVPADNNAVPAAQQATTLGEALQQSNQKYMQALKELSDTFKKDVQTVPAAQRTQVIQQYQQDVAALQQEAEVATERIRQQYK